MKIKNNRQKNINPNPEENMLNVNPKIIPEEESSLLSPSFRYLNCSLVFTSKVLETHLCKSLKTVINCFSKWGKSLLKLDNCVPKKKKSK